MILLEENYLKWSFYIGNVEEWKHDLLNNVLEEYESKTFINEYTKHYNAKKGNDLIFDENLEACCIIYSYTMVLLACIKNENSNFGLFFNEICSKLGVSEEESLDILENLLETTYKLLLTR